MAAKADDRLKALQARAAGLRAPAPTAEQPASNGEHNATALEAAREHFGAALEPLVRGRTIERIAVAQIAPETRAEHRQPRLLPLPEDLLVQGRPAPAYAELVAELQELGASLKERQIQPIVVYPGTSPTYPAARYLVLVGHRRWTAAAITGLRELDAVVVEPPTPAERVLIQYTENEAREEFSDMERAWALLQLKEALGDVPWEDVEARVHLSRARRQQLQRMLAFDHEQQQRVAQLRLQETQLRPLHTALRAGELTAQQTNEVLARLGQIAATRAAVQEQDGEADTRGSGLSPRRAGIDGPTIARLVARARKHTPATTQAATPRWLPLLHDQVTRTSSGLQRAQGRLAALASGERTHLREQLVRLQHQVVGLLAQIDDTEDESV